MNKRKILTGISCILLAGLLVAGCGGNRNSSKEGSTASGSGPATVTGAAKDGGKETDAGEDSQEEDQKAAPFLRAESLLLFAKRRWM